jgi:hypothetical protein
MPVADCQDQSRGAKPEPGDLEQLAEKLLVRRCQLLALLLSGSGPPDATLVALLADTDRVLELVRRANGASV